MLPRRALSGKSSGTKCALAKLWRLPDLTAAPGLQAAAKAAGGSGAAAEATPVAAGAGPSAAAMDLDDDALLQQALAMSMQVRCPMALWHDGLRCFLLRHVAVNAARCCAERALAMCMQVRMRFPVPWSPNNLM